MDAAYTTTFKKTALFLTVALLAAAPFAAQAQTFLLPSGGALTLNGTAYACLPVNSSTATNFNYTAAQGTAVSGTDPRLTIADQNGNPASSFTTGNNLCFADLDSSAGITPGTHTITVTLGAQAPGTGTTTITITVVPTSGSGGNGGTTGSGLSATLPSNPLQLSSNLGSVGYNTFQLTNSTGSPINYSIATTYNTGSGWLYYYVSSSAAYSQTGSGMIAAGQTMAISVEGLPSGLANGTYTATFTITYAPSSSGGTGTITSLPVTFIVNSNSGGTTGGLTITPSTVTWSYSSSNSASLNTQIPNQTVTIASSTGASTYNFTVQPSASGYLLLANSGTSGSGVPIGNALVLTPQAGIASLATGTYQEAINVSDSNGNTGVITVNISVNGSQTSGITLSPAPVTISAAVGQSGLAQTTVTITSTVTGTVTLTVSGTGLSLANSSNTQSIAVTAFVASSFVVYGNPASLAANTYIGTLTATESTLSQTDQVNFAVGQSSGNTTGSVAPTNLQFNYELGTAVSGTSTSLLQQNITDSVAGNFSVTVCSTCSWLSVSPNSGSGPTTLAVSVNVASLSAGTYQGSFTVTTPAGVQTVNVTLLVTNSATPVVFANPPILNIGSYAAGSSLPTYTVNISSSDGSAIPFTAASSNQSWLTVQQLNTSTPGSVLLTVTGSALPNGLNVANLTVSSGAADSSLVVPVVILVSGSTSSGGALTLGSSSLTFSAVANGSLPATQALSVTASTNTTYTATATTQTGGNWLSISPSGSLTTSANNSLTVSVNQAGLAAGTYTGSISLVTSSGTQNVPVTLVVGASGSAGTLSSNPSSLPFSYQTGGTLPAAQGINITSSAGTTNFTVAVSTQSGGNWLSTNIGTGVTDATPASISVSVNPTSLSAGTYTGSVMLTPTGGTTLAVPVTLTVTGSPTVSATPTTLSLQYVAGSATTPTATIQVTGSAASLGFTATATSTPSGWLAVSPTSGSTGTSGASLAVTVNPSGLSAGTYTGSIVVAGSGSAGGSTTTTVTLTVTAPLPTISSVQNAASGAGGPVSPGEIVSIFAPAGNPIGPGTPAYLTLDTNGNVSTTLGGVQVLFNGIPAPLTYVSATQINAVVPYGVAGLFAPYVQVKYLGQSSNAFNLTTTSTVPGIFSQNSSGTGPGSILNSDGVTTNGPNHPAAKGSVVAVYMTGEGATSPTGITGKVNCPSGSSCSISQLPVPLLPVSVTLIDSNNVRYPATYTFAGEAPGLVSGVLQVDVVIPSNVPSGTLQLIIAVGGNSSQAGITVSVQ